LSPYIWRWQLPIGERASPKDRGSWVERGVDGVAPPFSADADIVMIGDAPPAITDRRRSASYFTRTEPVEVDVDVALSELPYPPPLIAADAAPPS
jgi:hypothetical protein